MTPLASVAMLEKLALLKIALCRAPALSSASSASLCAVLSVLLETLIRVLVSSFPLSTVLPPSNLYSSHLADRLRGLKITPREAFQRSFEVDVAYTASEGSV